jgi:hypothetical protein
MVVGNLVGSVISPQGIKQSPGPYTIDNGIFLSHPNGFGQMIRHVGVQTLSNDSQ